MTTWRIASDLATILVPIGVVAAVIAVLCAAVAGVAIMKRASGLCGGAVGVWIPAAMLSSVAGFAAMWTPLIVAVAALVAMLTVGGVVRAVLTATGAELFGRRRAEAVEALDAASPAAVSAGASGQTPATSTVPVLARSHSARAA